MADRTNDERLREITVIAARERARVEEIKRLRAELDAARARIAKLEQEPPMALVDFGVGVNWKGLHEDMQRLRAERDAARAEVASLREGQRELARAVNFLDMCNKDRIASGETGAMSDAWQWVEEAAREMIEAAKETDQ